MIPLETVLSDYTLQITSLNTRLDLLQSGKMRTGERVASNPEWVDTTDRDIAECQRQIKVLEAILARYSKAA